MNRRIFIQSIPFFGLLPGYILKQRISFDDSLMDANESICMKKFDLAASLKLRDKPINEVIVEIGKSFLGTDYAANTIEAPGEEHLIVNLQTLDCVTFYENSLVLARCIKKNKRTFDDYKKELQFVRYRGGVINGYQSRLHYTSDYFFDCEKKWVLENVTKAIGGVPFRKKINFMSTHPDSYPHLKESLDMIIAIRNVEHEMNRRTSYHIPKSKVKEYAAKIKNGDIIGITTSIEGLDCSHTGIAIWKNDKLHMMHAPVPGSKVQITDVPLWEYLEKIKKDLGIMVARPLEP